MIDTDAVLFRETDAVRELTLTANFVDVGTAVGLDLGFVVGFGVAVGFAVAAALVADDVAVGTVGTCVVAGRACPITPRAAGGTVGDGPALFPPREDPTKAARITTAIRIPIHVRRLHPPPMADGAAV